MNTTAANFEDATNATEEPIVSVESLSVSLGGSTVLSDVSCTIDRGRVVGVIGPNGAGKTTLLRAINGTGPIDDGEITVAGRSVSRCGATEMARLVGSVPQSTLLSFSFTVREIVEMGRHPHISRFGAMDHDDVRAVEAALETTETSQFADRQITAVSGGERQRVLVARALAQETPLLVLDEPTASLDINHATRTLSLVRELASEERTVIAAIHDLDLAARYCDELLLVASGDVIAQGSPAEVLGEDAIEAAFETSVAIPTDPVTATQRVVPLSSVPSNECEQTVHIVGHGGLARDVIVSAAESGITGSIGILSKTDSAVDTATAHGFETITTSPLSPPSEQCRSDLVRACDKADHVIAVQPLDETNRELLSSVTVDSDRWWQVEQTDEIRSVIFTIVDNKDARINSY